MTYSRTQRRKKLKRERPGPATKTFKKKQEKELLKQIARRRERPQPPLPEKKLGRNDPCPCGSGTKYKKCCYLGSDAAQSIQKFLRKLGESKYAKSTS